MRSFLAFLLVAAAYAAAPVHRVQEPIPNSYIVKVHNDVDLDDIISSVKRAGGNVGSVFKRAFKGFSVNLSNQVLDMVSKLPSVEYIEENGVARAQAVGSWGLDRIDARSTLYGDVLDDSYTPTLTGAGVDVYVIDSGVHDKHEDFDGRATQSFCASDLFDFLGGGNVDCNGHGTHCAGTVGSKTYGVATGVRIIGVKVLGCLGSGSTAGVIEGVEWVIEQATRLKALRTPSIACMSLTAPYSQSLNEAVDSMVDAGVQTAVAAGNADTIACDYSPGSSTKVITVASTFDGTDARTVSSNYGTCINIFAPGAFTTSTWIGDSNKETNTLTGTSMASAHVAGALALYLTEEELLNQSTAGVVTDPGPGSPNRFLYVQTRR